MSVNSSAGGLPTSAECLTSRMAQLYLSAAGLEDWSARLQCFAGIMAGPKTGKRHLRADASAYDDDYSLFLTPWPKLLKKLPVSLPRTARRASNISSRNATR